ncbi:MAG: 3-hydroxyacyl-ACP dehydratase FabZ [Armatimonadetes bacterium]|nr:3-hydroxyacyl-ACP dehydratase FabZ [Armatimonadota bacterium]
MSGTAAPKAYPNPEVAERYKDRRLEIEDILGLLPHRPPFLLVDRVIELDPGLRGVGIKNVSINEPFFVGHFPGHPIMPGVLIVEALAQVGGVVILTAMEREDRIAYFAEIKQAKFREPVRPGDQLRLEVTASRISMRFGRLVAWMEMKALVDDRLVAEAAGTFVLSSPL